MASGGVTIPTSPPGIDLNSVRIIVSGHIALCIDLDGTMIVLKRINNIDGREGKFTVPSINHKLLEVLKKIYQDAKTAAQLDKLHPFIFSARNCKETFMHLMKAYCRMRQQGLSHIQACKYLITIDKVVAALKTELGVDVPVATTYDDPGALGSSLVKLRSYEEAFFNYIETHQLEINNAVYLGSLEFCESYQKILEDLRKELKVAQLKAGERYSNKAAMLKEIYDVVLTRAGSASKAVSIIWFDDVIKMFYLTLLALPMELRSCVMLCPLDYERLGKCAANPHILIEHLYKQIRMRKAGAEAGMMVHPNVDSLLPPLHKDFAFQLEYPALLPRIVPVTEYTPTGAAAGAGTMTVLREEDLTIAAAYDPVYFPRIVPLFPTGRRAGKADHSKPTVLPPLPEKARSGSGRGAVTLFHGAHECVTAAHSDLEEVSYNFR